MEVRAPDSAGSDVPRDSATADAADAGAPAVDERPGDASADGDASPDARSGDTSSGDASDALSPDTAPPAGDGGLDSGALDVAADAADTADARDAAPEVTLSPDAPPDLPRDASPATDAGGDALAATPALGDHCTSDATCGPGLVCLLAGGRQLYGLEGPANGYCSLPCTSDTTCAPLGGSCNDFTGPSGPPVGYCLQNCTFGGPPGPGKCHRRLDVGCLLTGGATDVCLPACSQDRDCPAGRHCDVQTGLCADFVRPGDPLGAHCATAADGSSGCAGFCLGMARSSGAGLAHACTMPCVLGNLSACDGVDANTSLAGGPHGACAVGQGQLGDVGFCVQQCDSAADCSDTADPGQVCDDSVAPFFGHGACTF